MKQVDANINGEPMHQQQQTVSDPDTADFTVGQEDIRQSSLVHRRRLSAFHKLIEACKYKRLENIKSILNDRPELANQCDKHKRSLLHYAVILIERAGKARGSSFVSFDKERRGNDEAEGKEEEQQNEDDEKEGEERAQVERCIDCFDFLTERCDLKFWWQQDLDGLSILHMAVISSNVPLVRRIVFEHPYSVKYPLVCVLDNERHSPLHWAVITGNLECVKILIEFAGAKLAHEPDLNGATPLHYATQTNDYPKYRQQLRLMLGSVSGKEISDSSQNFNSQSSSTTTATVTTTTTTTTKTATFDGGKSRSRSIERQESSVDNGLTKSNSIDAYTTVGGCARSLEILDYLAHLAHIELECMDRDRRTPLLWAASSGNHEAIQLLLACGSNSRSCDINKLSALHCAASHGFTSCLECLLDVRQANTQKQHVNQPDKLNCTPLFYSVLSANIDCVEILLDRGAEADWQDTKGRTAAHFAALKGQLNALKLLQERGANLWLANKQGDLPLHYAIKSGRQQVVRWLLEHSPYKHAVNAINNFGRAPIHLAIAKDNLQMVNYLIKSGANLNQLVKVRDKRSAVNTTNQQKPQKPTTIVNGSGVHQTKNGNLYHYETALDMAKNFGFTECLNSLIENHAKTATEVISNRSASTIGQVGANVRSLFDLQSVEGPSPIGFETTSSNSSGSPMATNELQLRRQQLQQQRSENWPNLSPEDDLGQSQSHYGVGGQAVPKLSRPSPEALPQTESTGTSSLSQNSLNNVREEVSKQQALPKEDELEAEVDDGYATGRQSQAINHGRLSDSATALEQQQDYNTAGKRQKGGISYNNEHVNASIKYKLYGGQQQQQQQSRLRKERMQQANSVNWQSLPTNDEPTGGKTKSVGSRASQSAPIQGSFRGQEIITNVNVYTSPCPHCNHREQVHLNQQEICSLCARIEKGKRSAGEKGAQAATARERTRKQFGRSQGPENTYESALYSDETSDTVTTESEDPGYGEDEITAIEDDRRLPDLANATDKREMVPAAGHAGNYVQRPQGMRYLPPSQGYERLLPVILSDREERSTSVTSNEASQVSPQDRMNDLPTKSAVPSDRHQMASNYAQHPSSSYSHLAEVEPRFDRAQRGPQPIKSPLKMAEKYREQVRSPVGDYIRSPIAGRQSSGAKQQQQHQARATGYTISGDSNELPDYSQVKAKVDSHRPSELGTSTSADMDQPQAVRNVFHGTPTRSVSRQTVIRTRRLSVDSVELASSVERSIRKYKQENKLFEELQSLKRNQIRSGRANEALLVKRLVEHFKSDATDLIGLESYNGPYTYKSYERYLYDQLRKLSQSNRAKLSGDTSQKLLYKASQSDRALPSPLQGDPDQRNYFEEDLKAELELRRVMRGDQEGLDDYEDQQLGSEFEDSYVLEPSGALEELRVRGDGHELEDERRQSFPGTKDEPILGADFEKQEGEEEAANREQQIETNAGSSSAQTASSSSSSPVSSRRSSVEVERDKLNSLPLKVGSKDIEQQASSLSSSIIVDALGNVSRACSPTAKHVDEQLNKDGNQLVVANRDLETDETVDADRKGREGEEVEAVWSPSGRRRSVVNIGNKMEVIYHDVGIEINPATDSDHEKQVDDNEVNLNEEQARHDSLSSSSGNESTRLKSVDEEEVNNESEIEASTERANDEKFDGTIWNDIDASKQFSDESGNEVTVERVRDELQELVREESGVSRSELGLKGRDRVAVRRASSPHTYDSLRGLLEKKSDEESGGEKSPTLAVSSKKRRSSISTAGSSSETATLSRAKQTLPVEVSPKKVFNGYDLDEMHRQHKQKRANLVEVEEKERAAASTATKTKPSRDSDEQRQFSEIGTTDETVKLRKQTRTGEPNTKRPKRARSRLPKGKYEVIVNMDDIRRRWSPLRSRGKRQLSEMKQLAHSADGRSLTQFGSTIGDQLDGRGLRSSLVKSQPNLKRAGEGQLRREFGSVDEDETKATDSTGGEFANFTLLYEINTKLKDLSTGRLEIGQMGTTMKINSTKRSTSGVKMNWCHKKLVRIVDVRTVKRTLSLPESIIYSNDLLKRFNILKL